MWHSGRGPAGSVQIIRKGIKNGIQGKQSRGHNPGWTDPPEVLWAGTSHVRAQEAMQTQDSRSPSKAHPTQNEPQCHHREGSSSPSETPPERPTAFTEPPGEGGWNGHMSCKNIWLWFCQSNFTQSTSPCS